MHVSLFKDEIDLRKFVFVYRGIVKTVCSMLSYARSVSCLVDICCGKAAIVTV